jgi:hypothetical protein
LRCKGTTIYNLGNNLEEYNPKFGIMTTIKYKFDDLMNPVLKALKELGGSGTIAEILEKVSNLLSIPTDQLGILHN